MNTTEALDIHANPDGNTGARWREARAVLEAAVKDAELARYQERALVTAGPLETERDRLVCGALGLTGEAGEAADLVKKHLYHGHPLDRVKLQKELGDVLWYLVLVADALGLTLSDVAEANLVKVGERYPDGFDPARSLHRPAES